MRLATLTVLLALLLFLERESSAKDRPGGYIGTTKRELVRLLGLPAEIELPTEGAPAREIWEYFWDHPTRGIQGADFQVCGNIVCRYASDFDAKRLISTESPDGFERVYRYLVKRARSRPPR
jgi:hypothetical protein